MKKRTYAVILSLILVLTMIPSMAFAQEDAGELLMEEKISEALTCMEQHQGDVELTVLPDGRGYAREVYDLGDGAQLIMEFEDGAEDQQATLPEAGSAPSIMPMATNGETMWKDYGNRYFTAKATVTVEGQSCVLTLENHYILSSSGIEENYGTPSAACPTGMIADIYGPYVLVASARTIGSEVSMYANYMLKKNNLNSVMLTTSVQYVDKNASAGQIKVKHSWSVK